MGFGRTKSIGKPGLSGVNPGSTFGVISYDSGIITASSNATGTAMLFDIDTVPIPNYLLPFPESEQWLNNGVEIWVEGEGYGRKNSNNHGNEARFSLFSQYRRTSSDFDYWIQDEEFGIAAGVEITRKLPLTNLSDHIQSFPSNGVEKLEIYARASTTAESLSARLKLNIYFVPKNGW